MMKPTTVRSLSEVVGALGVFAGLLFVGLELRNNTAVARAETRREVAAQNIEMMTRITEDENLMYLWSQPWTFEFAEGLSAVQHTRLQFTGIAFILRLESTYQQFEQGLLDERGLIPYGFVQPRTRDPWFKELWAGQRPALDPDFVEYFESRNDY